MILILKLNKLEYVDMLIWSRSCKHRPFRPLKQPLSFPNFLNLVSPNKRIFTTLNKGTSILSNDPDTISTIILNIEPSNFNKFLILPYFSILIETLTIFIRTCHRRIYICIEWTICKSCWLCLQVCYCWTVLLDFYVTHWSRCLCLYWGVVEFYWVPR